MSFLSGLRALKGAKSAPVEQIVDRVEARVVPRETEEAFRDELLSRNVPESHIKTRLEEMRAQAELPEAAQALMPTEQQTADTILQAGEDVQTPLLQGREAPGNLNYDYLDTPEKVKELLQGVSEVNDGFRGERRAGRTFAETRAAADAATEAGEGVTVERLLKRRKGEVLNDAEITQARDILNTSADEIYREAERLGDPLAKVSDEEYVVFRQKLAVHQALQMQVSGATAEIARALNAHKITAQAKQLRAMEISQLLEAGGGRGVTKAIAKEIAAAGQKGGLDAVDRAIEKTWWRKAMDSIIEYRYGSMLSGTKTHMANILGNIGSAMMQIPERAVAGGIGAARTAVSGGTDRVYASEAWAQLYGWLMSVKDGFRYSWRALREDMAQFDQMDKLDAIDTQRHAISSVNYGIRPDSAFGKGVDWLGTAVRLPGRFLQAEDEFFKVTSYSMEIHAQAMRQGLAEGLTGDQLAKRVRDLVNDPHTVAHQAAQRHAQYTTFTNQLDSPLGKSLMKLRNLGGDTVPVGRVVIPFLRTPYNLSAYAIERSPIALLSPDFYQTIRAGGPQADLAMARLAVGSTIGATVGYLVMGGVITGNGPVDRKQRKAWADAGWKPNAISLNGKLYSYNRLDPIGMQLGMFADAVELIAGAKGDDVAAGEIALSATVGLAQNLVSKQYLQGLSDVLELIDRDGANMSQVRSTITGLISSFVPAISGHTAYSLEDYAPELRNTASFWQEAYNRVAAKVPGWGNLEPRVDSWGNFEGPRDYLGPQWSLGMAELPIQVGEWTTERHVLAAMENAEPPPRVTPAFNYRPDPSRPSISLNLQAIAPELYTTYQVMVGHERTRHVKRLVETRKFNDAPIGRSDLPDTQGAMLSDQYSKAKAKAKKAFEDKYRGALDAAYSEARARGVQPETFAPPSFPGAQ